MSINIQAKTNYSFLFGSLGSSNGKGSLGNLNFLSDYASIKNGSYGKLMKAYYAKDISGKEVSSVTDKKKTASTSVDSTEALANVQKATDSLKDSADALLNTDKNSVFGDKLTDDTYKAVSKFVKDYNASLSATDKVNSTSILNRTLNMTSITADNEDALAKAGITVNKDNSLSIDKDTFMKADAGSVKSLFNGIGSYAYRVSAQSSFINFAADNEAAKANTYNVTGKYNNPYSTGNIFNSFF